MGSVLSVLLASVQKRGCWETARLIGKNVAYQFRRCVDRRFDRKYGTDTCDRIELENFDVVGSNRAQGIYYEPTPTALFGQMLHAIRSDLSFQDFVFIDFGSGKGRTLLMASDYPFKSIIGVEFARELHVTAQQNIGIYGAGNLARQQCRQLSSVHSDASSFEPPPENLLVYFYNPFRQEVMQKVLDNLARVASENGIKVALVYFNPLASGLIERSGMFVRHREIALPHDYSREHQRKCLVYFNWPVNPDAVMH